MPNGCFSWFALQVRTQRERAVCHLLQQKNYDLFLPTMKRAQRGYDRIRLKEIPVFPGYLFCRLNPSNRLPILITPGVIRIGGNGAIPIPIDEEEIAALQVVITSGRQTQPVPFLNLGDKVRIEGGPLQGVEGILTSIKNSRKLVVSISLLQRSVGVEIDSDHVVLSRELSLKSLTLSKRLSGLALSVSPASEASFGTPDSRDNYVATNAVTSFER